MKHFYLLLIGLCSPLLSHKLTIETSDDGSRAARTERIPRPPTIMVPPDQLTSVHVCNLGDEAVTISFYEAYSMTVPAGTMASECATVGTLFTRNHETHHLQTRMAVAATQAGRLYDKTVELSPTQRRIPEIMLAVLNGRFVGSPVIGWPRDFFRFQEPLIASGSLEVTVANHSGSACNVSFRRHQSPTEYTLCVEDGGIEHRTVPRDFFRAPHTVMVSNLPQIYWQSERGIVPNHSRAFFFIAKSPVDGEVRVLAYPYSMRMRDITEEHRVVHNHLLLNEANISGVDATL